jgi:DNA-damage-inducible protein D
VAMSEKKDINVAIDGDIEVVNFNKKSIRRIKFSGEWWYSVIDIVNSLLDKKDEAQDKGAYWRKLKERLKNEGGNEVVTKCHELKLPASDGKNYLTDCANVESIFRIIQSVPSKKAEPFKKWLAKTGYERLQEYENPELAFKRAIADYISKGYPEEWIKVRMQSISTRNELTKEWDKRDVENHYNDNIKGKEYAILTNVISQNTFGVTTKEHQNIKGLKKQNLRDHMTPIELIFNMLGEQATIDITKEKNAKGFYENLNTAKEGGKTAGIARKAFEESRGINVVSSNNFLKRNINDNLEIENDFKNLIQQNNTKMKDNNIQITQETKENNNFEANLEKIITTPFKK